MTAVKGPNPGFRVQPRVAKLPVSQGSEYVGLSLHVANIPTQQVGESIHCVQLMLGNDAGQCLLFEM